MHLRNGGAFFLTFYCVSIKLYIYLQNNTSTKLKKMREKSLMACEIQAVYQEKDKIEKFKLTSSRSSVEYARKVFPVDIKMREAVICIYISRQNEVIGFATISIGGLSGSICDEKTVFQHGFLCNASVIVLVHNHPSGSLKPSSGDISLTNDIKACGKFMDMQLLDHVILTEESYYSFADEGIL